MAHPDSMETASTVNPEKLHLIPIAVLVLGYGDEAPTTFREADLLDFFAAIFGKNSFTHGERNVKSSILQTDDLVVSRIPFAAAFSPAGVGPQDFHPLVIGVNEHLDQGGTNRECDARAAALSE